MLKKFQDAEDKMKKATEDYKKLRSSCKHTGVKTWKTKYGGYFCEDCEIFLPRSKDGIPLQPVGVPEAEAVRDYE